jgi:hypothetical protein
MDRYVTKYPQGRARAREDERPTEPMETTTPTQGLRNRTTFLDERTCSCGKVCKNTTGLKIHRTKMGCSPNLNLMQRARQLGETEEELDQEIHHSVQSLPASEVEVVNTRRTEARTSPEPTAGPTSDIGRKEQINWPSSTEKSVWKLFEEEVDQVLEVTLAGSAVRKLQAMSNIIYAMGKERFELVERKKHHAVYSHNRRAQKISNIRKNLKDLKKKFRTSTKEEKAALAEIREDLRTQLKSLRQAIK